MFEGGAQGTSVQIRAVPFIRCKIHKGLLAAHRHAVNAVAETEDVRQSMHSYTFGIEGITEGIANELTKSIHPLLQWRRVATKSPLDTATVLRLTQKRVDAILREQGLSGTTLQASEPIDIPVDFTFRHRLYQ